MHPTISSHKKRDMVGEFWLLSDATAQFLAAEFHEY